MTLEEIKQLSDAEICYHLEYLTSNQVEMVFVDTGKKFLTPRKTIKFFSTRVANPVKGGESIDENEVSLTLSKSPDAIAEIEKIVIEKVGHQAYSTAIHRVLFEGLHRSEARWISHISSMSARKKAEACLLALTNKENV